MSPRMIMVDRSLAEHSAIRLLYRPVFVMDGNFELQHLKMRHPEDDVALRNGGGHMTTKAPYMEHLRTAPESKTVGPYISSKRDLF